MSQMMNDSAAPSSGSNRRNVTIALMVATFLTAIEGTIVSTAMPTIVSELHGLERMNWVFAVYLLTSAVTTPIFGKLADLFGRKIIFTIGTVLFLIGSTLCGFAQNMDQLIWFRALQGIGAGAIMPVTFTIIGDLYPMEQRARVQGIIGMIWGVAGVVGPLVGGFFVDVLTWHWIFFINVPFGLLSMVLVAASLKESFERSRKKIDYAGAVTFTIGMVALLYALQRGSETHSWTSSSMLLLYAAAVIFLALFLYVQTKASEPMLPLKLFRIRDIAVASAVSFLTSMVMIGIMVYIPMWIQGVLGYGATFAGFAITPMTITWTVGAFFSGRLLVQKGSRYSAILGIIVLIAGSVWLALLDISASQFAFYVITGLYGIGFGIVVTVFTVTAQSAVDWTMRGVSTASITLFRTLGQTFGVAVYGTYFNSRLASELSSKQAESGGMKLEDINRLINPETAAQLPEGGRQAMREVLVSGMHSIFLLLVVFSVAALAISFLLPKRQSGAQPAVMPAKAVE